MGRGPAWKLEEDIFLILMTNTIEKHGMTDDIQAGAINRLYGNGRTSDAVQDRRGLFRNPDRGSPAQKRRVQLLAEMGLIMNPAVNGNGVSNGSDGQMTLSTDDPMEKLADKVIGHFDQKFKEIDQRIQRIERVKVHGK